MERGTIMGLFGNLVDFAGDGTTDVFEAGLGLRIVLSIGGDEQRSIADEDEGFDESVKTTPNGERRSA